MLWIRPLPTSQSQEIFGRDESKVSFINSKFNQYAPENLKDHTPNNKQFGEDGNFLVDVAFGTPPQKFTRYFDPSASSTYSSGSCIPAVEDNYTRHTATNLPLKETMDAIPSYWSLLMCTLSFNSVAARNNKGDFGSGVDGVLGLGQGQLSTVSQTASKFNKVFSYCLPEEDSIGSLLFGEKATSQSSLKFTSLVNGPEPQDSGTVITRLPQRAYSAVKAAFKKAMAKYPLSNGRRKENDMLDTCYNLTGTKDVLLPEIVLHFGRGADVRLNGTNIVWGSDASRLAWLLLGPPN
ncbi:Aspartyl protease family protein [Vitis vinifera]|uniref:Aspartyl protease family protein n=1 Tax=Vitis vinifera TaxID=29760 RepID=A0A438GF90_VITVI|nr:Aspartyl protease family protein [Vitis vinifera]